ncbi:nucleolar protein 10 lethal (2) 34Fd [Bombus vancouverensis nearcticus]|uniref:Nucleolar protein 10 n=1 Tax=Bombus bifarius TaxID=103933 RepID=A0A6P8N2J8_9HYME|nr:nucleolar protein 10 [Bombus vancouverensis nearcticus]XP_033320386.1 nucleolar protein 10 [Bombus bifarius]
MQVSCPNDVKIYNLSAGKSLPEWLSERKRRSLLKKNVDIRRRIELIQDFDMPGVSTSIKISNDGQYIFATGIYKPRVKCFDVKNLSLKFERCFDSEVAAFDILSDDYSKLVFLRYDRGIEFHVAYGKYYVIRVPRFGRDIKYHYPSCDLFVVGDSSEIYRINLERGQFLQSFLTEAPSINKCEINPVHHLLTVGTEEGKVEVWDPRVRNKVGSLDCALHCVGEDNKLEKVPAVTSLRYQGGLTLGVGTLTGQILLYDIRSSKPFLVKDHMYGLPIKNIEFHQTMDMVYSMDSSIVKIWEKNNGKLYTSIEAQHDFNDMCVIPNTGMVLIANENTKMQTFYIPSLGPAPHWCSFLDNLTEELEELNYDIIYDDYKFVTEKELEELSLSHLKGTNLLRAYMHGYFMDIRLYKKARDVMKPFEFEQYKKKKIQQKVEETRGSRVQIQKMPSVNKELALKLMDDETNAKKKKNISSNLLTDERFKQLFTNPDFQVDKNSAEYTLLNPVISQLSKSKAKKLKAKAEKEMEEEAEIDPMGDEHHDNSSDESFIHDDSSSEDEKQWVKEMKNQYRLIKKNERQMQENDESVTDNNERIQNEPQFYEIKEDVEFKDAKPVAKKQSKATLGERLRRNENEGLKISSSRGNREMTFSIEKVNSNNESKNGKDPPQQNHSGTIQESTPSGLSNLHMQSTEIGEITEMPDFEMLNTSAVLHYCKHKILRPYLRLLGVMGLKPISNDDSQRCTCYCIFANLHTCQVAIFMCIGYILQYMACFRRDRGFCYKTMPLRFQFASNLNKEDSEEITCFGNVIFSYLVPSILHLVAYIYTVYLFRIKENEQLQNLMERAFLLSSNSVNRGNQRRLVRILWFFIALSLVWIIMALITVNVLMARGSIIFQWLEHSPYQLKITMKVLLIVCTLWHDMVQGTIITSYCLQGQLLLAHLYFLREKLLHHTLAPIDWMREISEFKKLLKYFNNDLGPAVCIYTIVNLSWAAAGTIWLLRYDNSDMKTNSVTWVEITNVVLWILISIVPFIQAARLTTACSMIQSIGHEVRIRPFVYQSTPGEDLDTILLYTSSLEMYARLFRVPITGRYLCLFLTIGSILILTLGQCQFF